MLNLKLSLAMLILFKIYIQSGSGSHPRHHHESSVTPIFGFGVGYKKVSHYVPVLTFQTRKKKPHHSSTDVVFVNQPGDGRPSVTISGNDQDRDQSEEIQTLTSNTGTRRGSQQNLASNGLNVQYHNLRSDDMDHESFSDGILHSDRRLKHHHHRHQSQEDKYSRDYFPNGKNGDKSRRRNTIKHDNHRDRSNSVGSQEDLEMGTGSEEDISSHSSEMNEYTIGDFNWDWKPKRGNRNVFGFNRFFGNRPRSNF